MGTIKNIKCISAFLLAGMVLICTQCSEETISDVKLTAALRNVEFSYDSMQYVVGLPEGALDGGQSLAVLLVTDSARFRDLSNYSIAFVNNMKADNTKSDAEEAKFDGAVVNVVLDTIESTPIETVAEAFIVEKNTIKTFAAEGSINLATHRLAGKYMFRQMVDGNDLSATFSPVLLYKFGSRQGTINLPSFHRDIPTRATPEMKEFLSQLLDSGILDE